jgi:hypothetical protein
MKKSIYNLTTGRLSVVALSKADIDAALERADAAAGPMRRAEVLARLAAIDAESIRPAREVAGALAAGKAAPAFAVGKLAALETEAAALRAELAGL